MHPFLFHVGNFFIPTYGVVGVLTLIVALLTVRRFGKIEGRDPQETMDAVFFSIVAGFVTARVMEFAINSERYLRPGGWKLLLSSAGVMVGAILGSGIFGALWFRKIKLPMLQGLDLLGPVGAITEAIGRWGCFLSGCCWGTPTSLPWGVTFPPEARQIHAGLPDVPIHPVQVYLSLNSALILVILLWLYKRKRFHGQIICAYIFLYALTRFFIEFVRGDAERGTVLGGLMSTSQFVCILLALVSVGGYFKLEKRHRSSGAKDWKPARG